MINFIILSIMSKIGKYITGNIRLARQATIRKSRRVRGGVGKHTIRPKRHLRIGGVEKNASCIRKKAKDASCVRKKAIAVECNIRLAEGVKK